jgi:hypothetical protein
LRFLLFQELARPERGSFLVLLLLELHRLSEGCSLLLQQRLLFRKLPPLPFRVLEFQLRLHGVARRFDGPPGVEPRQHVTLGYRLTLSHVKVHQLSIDRRIEAPDFRGRRQCALFRHDHVRPPDERPGQPAQHQGDHRVNQCV